MQRKVPGLKRAVGRYKNLTDTNWLTKDKFLVESGKVKVRLKGPGSAPASSSGSASLMPLSTPPTRDGGASSSRALPSNYNVPALVFRQAVEQPVIRARQQEAKGAAEALKEEQRKAKRDAQQVCEANSEMIPLRK